MIQSTKSLYKKRIKVIVNPTETQYHSEHENNNFNKTHPKPFTVAKVSPYQYFHYTRQEIIYCHMKRGTSIVQEPAGVLNLRSPVQYCSGRACGAIIFILMSDYKSRQGTVVQRRGQNKPLNLFTTLIIPRGWLGVCLCSFCNVCSLKVSYCGRL